MTSNLLAALKVNGANKRRTFFGGAGVEPQPPNPFIEAAKAGDVDRLKELLKDPKHKVDQKDPAGMTALMHAAKNSYLDVCKALSEGGARFSAKDNAGETALMMAAKNGSTSDVIRFLVDAQIEQRRKAQVVSLTGLNDGPSKAEQRRVVDATDDEGVTALMKAAEAGQSEVVELLISLHANAEAKDDEGWRAIMWAAMAGQLPIVEWLVTEHSQEVDYQTENGENALMKAAASGHWDVCKFLLDNGAKVNAHDREYQTPLMWAAAAGHLHVVQGLISFDAKVDTQSRTGKTALILASTFGRADVCKYLVEECKVRVDTQDNEGFNALSAAIGNDDSRICSLLIDHGCPLEAHTTRGETPLILSARYHALECAKLLLQANANLFTADENGQTASDHAEGTLSSRMSPTGEQRTAFMECLVRSLEGSAGINVDVPVRHDVKMRANDQRRETLPIYGRQSQMWLPLADSCLGEKPYVPIVFFANKMDLPDAASLEEISAGIGLPSLASSRRPTNIVRCSATTGEGVEEGIMWLIDMIKQNRNAAASTQLR
ncbi:ankyrin repeat domain containing protein [Perkinsus marinus ATCC 50983]|uniref:Ankyrin repeat domain containing protein n=1 Tax=Perkinsus marinus (strain ATCC 50983 / TXsc) TaxID=423536 RepID=C5KHV7_PERM5|nr:ankyrin repeat domain containing protein [Perkinsus marinus ATCC 50983]EER16169.1 ankyrin repeat domain containing protein [Perkinsus marinus ATCC 50983]|eukprot:XP_002784373.1 ankyrin repeat domain containing protein [Perkinsus marinus ATCC 50983]